MRPNIIFLVVSTVFATCHAAFSVPLRNPLLRATPNCTSAQIANMDVENCACQPQNHNCESTCQSCGGVPALTMTKKINDCRAGCTEDEWSCEACGIWFHTLCNCLQHPSNCPTNRQILKGRSPIWVHLETDGLVTTTERLPGILEMSARPQDHDEGWIYAQRVWGPKQALALNPYRVRTHEQVHIHICPRNRDTYRRISLANPAIYLAGGFHPLVGDPKTFCVTVSPGRVMQDFATKIAGFLSTTTTCRDLVGAGIMRDNRGYTWGCVTTDSAGPLGVFC